MLTHEEFIERVQSLPKTYVKTHRSGNTGIGKTLEDLLGIEENNIQGPDTQDTELKAGRKNSPSMLTLFTKTPQPRAVNAELLKKHGYPDGRDGKNILHCTLTTQSLTTLKGKGGLKLNIDTANGTKRLAIENHTGEVDAYWTEKDLRDAFLKKYDKGQLYYIKAKSRFTGKNEEFLFDEGYFLKGFDYSNMVQLLNDGVIKVDIRIGQYPDGRTHDHGTAFRIMPDKLDLCFNERIRIL